MDVLEVQEKDAAELYKALESAGVSFSVGKEERYFGDAHTISVILDITKSVAIVVSALISFFKSRSSSTIVINGIEIKVSNPATEADKEKITKALRL